MGVVSAPKYVAEFVGTFILVFTVCCNILSGVSATWAPLSIASVLMALIYALGGVSGAHFNPAVTLTIAFAKMSMSSEEMLGYMVVQVLGGITAARSAVVLFPGAVLSLGPQLGFTWWHVMIVEVLYTAMLCFVALNVAVSKTNNPEGNGNQFYGLAIAFVVVAGGYAVGGISGGCFNPAVSLGLAVGDMPHVGWAPTYCIFQAVGAGLAALLFRAVRPEEYTGATDYQPTLPTKLASEYVGVHMLVFTVGCNILSESTATAFSAAAALMCMIYSLGDVSGGHFNPAVTMTVLLSNRNLISVKHALYYVVTQVSAAIAAMLLCASLFGRTPGFHTGSYPVSTGCVAEFAYTFLLAIVVLGTGTITGIESPVHKNFYFGLAISSCVTAGGFAIGGVSGGYLNPAVATGVAATEYVLTDRGLSSAWSRFVFAELAAGAVAAVVFYVTHAKVYREDSEDQKKRLQSPDANALQARW